MEEEKEKKDDIVNVDLLTNVLNNKLVLKKTTQMYA